jgi:hypothetical protein
VTKGVAGGNGPYGASAIGRPSVSPDGQKLWFTTAERLSPTDTDDRTDLYRASLNSPPSCAQAAASPALLRPANHRFRRVEVIVDDPDGDPVSISIDGVTQDEPVDGVADGSTSPDARPGGGEVVLLRAERSSKGDGRVYRIAFTATDSQGAGCSGVAKVSVPRRGHSARDSAPPSYDSFER